VFHTGFETAGQAPGGEKKRPCGVGVEGKKRQLDLFRRYRVEFVGQAEKTHQPLPQDAGSKKEKDNINPDYPVHKKNRNGNGNSGHLCGVEREKGNGMESLPSRGGGKKVKK